jgi:2-keto-4-pentenoate hydratase
MLSDELVEKFADELLKAERERNPIDPLTDRVQLTIEDAYKIQKLIIKKKIESGAKIVGRKIGLTNKAMQRALGVYEPDYGHLLDIMEVYDGEAIKLSELIQPRIEVELAFIFNEDIRENVSYGSIVRAVEGVVPAFEVIDSRIKNWKIKIQDTIADNASSARFILGEKLTDIKLFDLRTIGVVVRRNGEIVQTGVGANVLNDPINSVMWLAKKLLELGDYIKAGDVVLSGSLIAPIDVNKGDAIEAEFGCGLGSVHTYFI